MATEERSKPFLSRWSQRKLAADETAAADNLPSAETTPVTHDSSVAATNPESPSVSAPAQTEEEKPFWQRDDIDPQEKQQAMRDLFRKPKFNQIDGLDEYDNDYNYHNFAKLGDVITHEMRRRLAEQADALAASATSTENVDKAAASPEPSAPSPDNKEEKPLA